MKNKNLIILGIVFVLTFMLSLSVSGYNLSSATGTYNHELDLDGGLAQVNHIEFFDDGNQALFVTEVSGKTVQHYSFSSPYDISTATLIASSNLVGYDLPIVFAKFDSTGNYIYYIEKSGSVVRYYKSALSTPFDITSSSGSLPTQMAYHSSNFYTAIIPKTNMNMYKGYSSSITQYNFSTEFGGYGANYNLANAVDYTFTPQNFNASEENILGINFNEFGTRFYIAGVNKIFEYELSTPYDLESATHVITRNKSEFTGISDEFGSGISFGHASNEENYMYLGSAQYGRVYDYDINLYPESLDIIPDKYESTFSVEQGDTVTVSVNNQWTTIIEGEISLPTDYLNYGSTTIQTYSQSQATVECKTTVNDIDTGDNIIRTNYPNEVGSLSLIRPDISGSGDFSLKVLCKKNGGLSHFEYAVGIGHVFDSSEIFSTDFENDFTVSGTNQIINSSVITPTYDGVIILESGATITSNLGGQLSLQFKSDDNQSCGVNKRDLTTGENGAIGGVCSFDVQKDVPINISLYGTANNPVNISGITHLKILSYGESVPIQIVNVTQSETLIATVEVNNVDRKANVFMKSNVPIENDGETVNFRFKVDGVAVGQEIPYTISSSIKQSLQQYLSSAPDKDYFNVSLYATSEDVPTSSITTRGGNLIAYVTEDYVVTDNFFTVSAYDIDSNLTLDNFEVDLGEVEYSTTDGDLTIFTSEDFVNFTIHKLENDYNYFGRNIYNHNTSENINLSVYKGTINLNNPTIGELVQTQPTYNFSYINHDWDSLSCSVYDDRKGFLDVIGIENSCFANSTCTVQNTNLTVEETINWGVRCTDGFSYFPPSLSGMTQVYNFNTPPSTPTDIILSKSVVTVEDLLSVNAIGSEDYSEILYYYQFEVGNITRNFSLDNTFQLNESFLNEILTISAYADDGVLQSGIYSEVALVQNVTVVESIIDIGECPSDNDLLYIMIILFVVLVIIAVIGIQYKIPILTFVCGLGMIVQAFSFYACYGNLGLIFGVIGVLFLMTGGFTKHD